MKQFVIVVSTIMFGKRVETRRIVWAYDADDAIKFEKPMVGFKFERVEEYVEPKRRVRA